MEGANVTHQAPAGIQLPKALETARINTLPSSAFYIPDFITVEEEHLILQKIAAAPKPRWKHLTHRRLQTWPSDLLKNALIDEALPLWLVDPVIPRLLSVPRFEEVSGPVVNLFSDSPHKKPNHVLINEYPPGVGIMPHKDGPAYHPVVCTVSLGSSLCLNIHRSKDDGAVDTEPAWRILQEPRSLLVTTASLYTDLLHGIADIEEDVDLSAETVANWSLLRDTSALAEGRNSRATRTSLTYRDVLKVVKLGNKGGGGLLGLAKR